MTYPNHPQFSVLILCGGKSSRMGQDKALLQLNGETLLQRAVRLGHQLGAAQVLISRNQSGFIQDQVQNAGPMAGIAAALSHCSSRWLLVLPIDMPLLSPLALNPLLRYPILQRHGGFIEGFPLPVMLEKTEVLQQLLAGLLADPSASRSLKSAWNMLGLKQLPMQTPEAFQNSNNPADFAKITALLATPVCRQAGVAAMRPCTGA